MIDPLEVASERGRLGRMFDRAPGFMALFEGPDPQLVMANQAFASLLTELSLAGLADVPQAVLENTLKYHVVAGANVLSTNLTNNMMVETFQGQSFSVQLMGGAAQITDANGRISMITAADVQAANGVIHVLDKVLLPAL